MATNIPYFSKRLDFVLRRDNGVRVFSSNQHLDTSHVKKLVIATCEICYASGQSTSMCPTFQNDLSALINTFEGFSILSQTWNDSYSNGYDQEWWDNFNFNYTIELIDFQHQYQ